MTGEAIGAQAIAAAALRRLVTEQVGPRPAGTPADGTEAREKTAQATRP